MVQGHNPKFLEAGKVSWNKETLIVLSTTHEKRASREKFHSLI